MIDATRNIRPTGTITFLQPPCMGELPRGLGAHDFGLKDLFTAAARPGQMPRIHLPDIPAQEARPACPGFFPGMEAAWSGMFATVLDRTARLAAGG